MTDVEKFLRSILDSVAEHIMVIDEHGNILFVNRDGIYCGSCNPYSFEKNWTHVNYLDECDKVAAAGGIFGLTAAAGIRAVIEGKETFFSYEYLCDGSQENRWFLMRVTPLEAPIRNRYIISHQDITERKVAEEGLLALSCIDGLTDIANRRAFDQFLHEEWLRCARQNAPISLALLDIDYFKLLNDHYGHPQGDACLKKVANLLKAFTQRPSDICARYGGDEFALIYGNTDADHARTMGKDIMKAIAHLAIPNVTAPTGPQLTVSIGIATLYPAKGDAETDLIGAADKQLYRAKNDGRNRIAQT